MRKNHLYFLLLLLIFFSMTNGTATAEKEAVTWELKTITDSFKTWTIHFSEPVRNKAIGSEDIFITTSENKLVPSRITFSNNLKSVIITPLREYKAGVHYQLHVKSSVRSNTWNQLEHSIILPFALKGNSAPSSNNTSSKTTHSAKEESKTSLQVSVSKGDYFGVVRVEAADTIAKVSVNGYQAEYKGNNRYEVRLASIETGKVLAIQGYNASGRSIARLRYVVE